GTQILRRSHAAGRVARRTALGVVAQRRRVLVGLDLLSQPWRQHGASSCCAIGMDVNDLAAAQQVLLTPDAEGEGQAGAASRAVRMTTVSRSSKWTGAW